MINVLKSTVVKSFAVTIALTLGAVMVVTGLYFLALSGPVGGTPGDVEGLPRAGLIIIGNAALAGLMADAVRWVAAVLWQARPGPQ